MIWTIDDTTAFNGAFLCAGTPDQAVIDAYLQKTRRPPQPQRHQGAVRYYYLLKDDPRVSLACIGLPLDAWAGLPAMLLVGTREIIGEFAGNQEVIGRKGLQLTMKPLEWFKGNGNGNPDQHFEDAVQVVEAISFQVLDLEKAEQSQERIKQKYRWS